MSKKPSLAAALQTFDRTSPAAATQPRATRPQGQRHKAKEEREGEKAALSTQAPSRTGKKALIGYFDPSVSKQLKQIALDRDGTIQDLLTEALNDLFQKLKKPTIA
jgi:antitoxin-like ribbon-helix-helix protein